MNKNVEFFEFFIRLFASSLLEKIKFIYLYIVGVNIFSYIFIFFRFNKRFDHFFNQYRTLISIIRK